MTREEVINLLLQMRKDGEGFLSDSTIEAYDMAIKALEQQPCEDCISRQAVLEEAFEVDTKEYGRIDVVGVDAINSLPPVTPQPKTGHWIYEPRKRLMNETDDGAEYITDYWCKCSNCGGDFGYIKMKDAFCKYCGAKMVEP